MLLYIDAGFDNRNAFAFEEFALQAGVRFTNEDFAVGAENAVPGNASARWTGSHRAASTSCAADQAQSFGEGSIC
jgi:hypothetical protein